MPGDGVQILPTGLRTFVSKEIDKSPSAARPELDWKVVVDQIRAGDPAGEEALYQNLAAGARLFLQRRLGAADVEDRVHNVFVIVVEAIRRGELREPERLMGFVRTVLNRQLGLAISGLVRTREHLIRLDSAHHLTATDPSPEEHALSIQKVALMKQALKEMSDREFDILMRFYLREQPPEQIQSEMHLTPTQFNLLKSRAKAKLTELVRQKLARNQFSRE
jgi:RNA polymerase sigma-70 factor (ECF subfamily)